MKHTYFFGTKSYKCGQAKSYWFPALKRKMLLVSSEHTHKSYIESNYDILKGPNRARKEFDGAAENSISAYSTGVRKREIVKCPDISNWMEIKQFRRHESSKRGEI